MSVAAVKDTLGRWCTRFQPLMIDETGLLFALVLGLTWRAITWPIRAGRRQLSCGLGRGDR
jgi:hypothetical protein